MYARLRGSKSLKPLYQIKLKPDFPSLADEIAEPHPDINIKVAAFTVSEKSSNTRMLKYIYCIPVLIQMFLAILKGFPVVL